MPQPLWLLESKYRIPQPRPGAVPRPDLWRLLDLGAQRKLTLLSAPAGFGKTTLLSQWLAAGARRAAWIALEEADNLPVRFWTYVAHGLAPHLPDAAEALKAALQHGELPPPEALLAPLLNGFLTADDHLTLVLDDFHLIRTPQIHQAIAFLVDHMPPALHLVLVCRGDPPLPLARWRAREELAEVRAQDLRFSEAEAATFLNGGRGLDLSTPLVEALHQRTEGWVTGLQLAALSLRERRDAGAFVAAFAGSHRFVLDYLVGEVLDRQPAHVKQFLLETSVVGRLSAPLCAAVTGMAESRQILQYLEEADLFLVPLDDDRQWYRYHQLFGEMLRAHLQHARPDAPRELHLRAADWFAGAGMLPDAIGHALGAKAWERAAGLIEAAAEDAWSGGEVPQLIAWMQALPEAVLHGHPRLCVLYARTLIPTGKVEEIARLVESATATMAACGARAGGAPGLVGEVTAMQAQLARLRGDLPAALALSQQALTDLPPAARGWRGMTALAMGGCHRMAGQLSEALQAFGEGAADCTAAGNAFLALTARNLQAEVYAQQGRLRLAYAAFRAAAAEAAPPWPIAGWAMVGEGEILAEWDRLDEAAALLERGIELGRNGRLINVVVPGLLSLMRVRLAQQEAAEGARLLAQAVDEARASRIPRALGRVLPAQVRLALARGDVVGASALLEMAPVDPATRARVQLAAGQPDQALETLAALVPPLRRRGEGGALLEALVLQALALAARGGRREALAVLQEALALAEPEGYLRCFREEGEPLQSLLADLADAGGPGAAMSVRLLQRAPGTGAPSLVEPLSDRELEVLRLIAAGATNSDIGQRLFVSVNTVKKHTTNIFGKLGVKSRTQALARARDLDLL